MATTMNVYEIRPGVFALAKGPGKAAIAVCQRVKNGYKGVRGRRPTIAEDAKRATGVSKAIRETLTALAN